MNILWGRSWPSAKLAMAAAKCWNEADDQVQHPAARHPVSQVRIEGTSLITAHVRTILAERLAHSSSSRDDQQRVHRMVNAASPYPTMCSTEPGHWALGKPLEGILQ